MGALYVRHGTNVLAQQQGGAQERYRRAGTENVAGAVGMAAALELSVAERPITAPRLGAMRKTLARHLRSLEVVQETGHPTERLPGLLSVVASGLDGNAVTMALDLAGLASSTGSACVSGSNETSHVLAAMGYPEDEARGALRFSIGRSTAAEEIDEAARIIATRSGLNVRRRPGWRLSGKPLSRTRPRRWPARDRVRRGCRARIGRAGDSSSRRDVRRRGLVGGGGAGQGQR
jgi:cysteine sulfinate desulfinase/cysteine desulfurase-like protein